MVIKVSFILAPNELQLNLTNFELSLNLLTVALPRALVAHGTEPHTQNIIDLFLFGCRVIDQAHASTDCTGG